VLLTAGVGLLTRPTLVARMAEKEAPTPASSSPATATDNTPNTNKAGVVVDDKPLILIAVDASHQAEHAVDWYLQYMHMSSHRILLLHVAEPPIVAAQRGANNQMTAEVWNEMVEKAQESVKTVESRYSGKLQEHKLGATFTAMFSARPGEAICEVAEDQRATYIVVGTRGLGTFQRTIMGSVSAYVMHHARCPVVIIRKPTIPLPGKEDKPIGA